jgi:hypothetical protein
VRSLIVGGAGRQLRLANGIDSEEIRGEGVSANHFSLLGIQPPLVNEFLHGLKSLAQSRRTSLDQ